MNIIKLSAIDSTNVFLKDLSKKKALKNFTTAVAEVQMKGKGQLHTHWHSEEGKNLLFTTFVDFKGLPVYFAPWISFLVAIKIREVLSTFLLEKAKLTIKWPNDILSYHQKIAGVLIENTVKEDGITKSFIGVGLNVNQLEFPENLSNAISMAKVSGRYYDREMVLQKIGSSFKEVLTADFIERNHVQIKNTYLKNLYKINTPSMFQDKAGIVFMGKIVNVTNKGLLVLEKEDEQAYTYAIKELKFL